MGYRDVNFPAYIRNQNDPIILDIGSYDGYDAMQFKQQFPNGRVYAIEASSHNIEKFHTAISMGVNVRHLAIGETDGEITFHPSIGPGIDGSGSILKPSAKMPEHHPLLVFTEERVACVTIPTFCAMENLDRIDCIHIDAQGAEIGIMRSMGDYRPDCVYAETCEYENYENAGSLQEMDDLMISMGYKIENRHYGPGTTNIWDTLYVRSDISFDRA
jgi:FkbM family methyltransferase